MQPIDHWAVDVMAPDPNTGPIELMKTIALSINHHVVTAGVKRLGYIDPAIDIAATKPEEFVPIKAVGETKRHCVRATAVGLNVYSRFGFEAEHMAFELEALPQKDFELGRPPRTNKKPETRKSWEGHLAPIVNGWIVDSTAGQKTNPEKGLFVPDCVMLPVDGSVDGFAEFDFENGRTILRYRQRQDNTGFDVEGGYWNSRELIADLAEFVVRDVNAELFPSPTMPGRGSQSRWSNPTISHLPPRTIISGVPPSAKNRVRYRKPS